MRVCLCFCDTNNVEGINSALPLLRELRDYALPKNSCLIVCYYFK